MKHILKFGLVLLLGQTAMIQAATTVTNIAAGSFYSFFIRSDGSLWAMGDNQFGQLGDGTYNIVIAPEIIISNSVTAISSSSSAFKGGKFAAYHSLFLKSDGSLWAMGDNYYGQLGDGTFNNTNSPEQIVSSSVVAIAGGYAHSLFIKSDGSLWAMGNNYEGQLGDGTYNITNKPEQIVTNGVTAIAAGDYHSLFLKSDGSLWAMGYNGYGQLGDGTANSTDMPESLSEKS